MALMKLSEEQMRSFDELPEAAMGLHLASRDEAAFCTDYFPRIRDRCERPGHWTVS